MIVSGDIFSNPKFLALRREVGPQALECLCRLWAHCAEDKRGPDWGKVDADYVELVCHWQGEPGRLFTALTAPKIPGKKPWIEKYYNRLVIHGWREYNANMVANWKKGPLGGRPKKTNSKPAVNPQVSPGLAADNQIRREEKRVEDHTQGGAPFPEAEWPSVEEFCSYAEMHGLPGWKAKQEWLNAERKRWKGIENWRAHSDWVRTLWEQAGRPGPSQPSGRPNSGAEKSGETHFQKVTREKALIKVLAEHPANPQSPYSGEPTDPQRAEYRRLEVELEEVRRELATKPK